MGDPKELKQWAEEIEDIERKDLANNQFRVKNVCYMCPFCKELPEKELSGNPKCKCDHPAVYHQKLEIIINQYGLIPDNCPLRINSITVFLDEK